MLEIRIFQLNDPEYQQELQLRDEVLRRPLGMSLKNDNLDVDRESIHVGAFERESGAIIGVLLLTPMDENRLKMRQVAVLQKQQRQGIGHQLVTFAEHHAFDNGFTEIVLHARQVAVGFYAKLGYEIMGDSFLEINIPHFKMKKVLSL